MAARTYKKYMKKNVSKDYTLLKLFVVSFFGMLLVFTFLIKSFSPSVDVSIGDYKEESIVDNTEEIKKVVDGRLAMIQEEDQGRDFTDLMKNAEDVKKEKNNLKRLTKLDEKEVKSEAEQLQTQTLEPVYKVFIGTYTSSEQAKVAKDIIVESGSNLNPIVKCIGSNNYTLQVGIFKNKNSAETLLFAIQQSNLPGRIVQEY
jgi:cell division protein FtsN